jgi:hypothetical protein
MRHALSIICLIATAIGCSDARLPVTTQGAKDVTYADFIVNVQSNSIKRAGINPSRLRAVPNSRFDIFEVLDANGRKSDEVWIKNESVFDWNQFKLLADTSVGGVVLRQRFQPDFPDGNPWDDFLIDASAGETGVQLESIPDGLSREQIHLIYVFQSAGLMAASYDANGKLIRISARHDVNATFWYPHLGSDSPFAAYKLPQQFNDSPIDPPLNDALRNGLGKITSSNYPDLALAHVVVVEEFTLGRVYSIREFDRDGQAVSNKTLQFSSRPYDREIMKAPRTGQ